MRGVPKTRLADVDIAPPGAQLFRDAVRRLTGRPRRHSGKEAHSVRGVGSGRPAAHRRGRRWSAWSAGPDASWSSAEPLRPHPDPEAWRGPGAVRHQGPEGTAPSSADLVTASALRCRTHRAAGCRDPRTGTPFAASRRRPPMTAGRPLRSSVPSPSRTSPGSGLHHRAVVRTAVPRLPLPGGPSLPGPAVSWSVSLGCERKPRRVMCECLLRAQ